MLESDELEGTKGKLNITPPSSPTSLSSFSSNPLGHYGNGYYDNPAATTRLSSLSSSGGDSGDFKFLDSRKFGETEVFTITNGAPNKTNSFSNKSTKSEVTSSPETAFTRDNSVFSEDRYKWTDNEVTEGPKTHRKTKTRKMCLILVVTVLVLGILAGLAVILAFTVFKDTGKDTPETAQSLVAIKLDGALSLDETWTEELDNPSSMLYLETERNFTLEMDRLMQQTNLSDSYIGTEVLKFSPGSIKVQFKMGFNDKYRLKVNSDEKLAERVEQEIKESVEKTPLRIARQTVRVLPIETATTQSSTTVTPDMSTVPSTVSSETSRTLQTSSILTMTLDSSVETSVLTSTSFSSPIMTSMSTKYISESVVSTVSSFSSIPSSVSSLTVLPTSDNIGKTIAMSDITTIEVSPTKSAESTNLKSTSSDSLSSISSFSSGSVSFSSALTSPISTSTVHMSTLTSSVDFSSTSQSLDSFQTSAVISSSFISSKSSDQSSLDLSTSYIISSTHTFSTDISLVPSVLSSDSSIMSPTTVSPSEMLSTVSSLPISTIKDTVTATSPSSVPFSSVWPTSSFTHSLSSTTPGITTASSKTSTYSTSEITTPSYTTTTVPSTTAKTSANTTTVDRTTADSSKSTTTNFPNTTTRLTTSTSPISTSQKPSSTSSNTTLTVPTSTTASTTSQTTSRRTPSSSTTTTAWTTISTILSTTTETTSSTKASPRTSTSTKPSTSSSSSISTVSSTTTPSSTRTTPSTTTTTSATTKPSTATTVTSTSTKPSTTTTTSSTITPSSTTTTSSSTTPSTTTRASSSSSPRMSTTTTASSTSSTTSSTTTETSTTPSTTTTKPTTSTTPVITTVQTTTSSTTSSTSTTATTSTTTMTTTTIEAPDRPPKANAGPDISINLPVNTVTLSALESTDDRGIVEYTWTQVSSLSVSMEGVKSATVKLTNLQEGGYVFRLTVRDAAYHTDTDIVRVYVLPELCVDVKVEACKNLGFLRTQYPNMLYQENETLAIQAFNHMSRSIHNQICQNVALSYLCSLYFPKCDNNSGYFIYPCKSLCEAAITSCSEYFVNPIECVAWPENECVEPPTPPTTTTTEAPTCAPTLEANCRNLGFNSTLFPNLLGEDDQEMSLETYDAYFRWVVEPDPGPICHPDVGYFICSVQFPLCVDGKQIQPCRRLCEEIVAACEEVSYFFCEDFPQIDCLAPIQPPAECRQNQFTCGKVTKCIDSDRVCDGVNDCSDWTDEMDCQCDPQYEFQCQMGMCIKSFQECDGVPHCPDNSDELHCDGCRNGQVKCPNTDKCIMREWLCDGRRECDDGWDEWNCERCSRFNFTCQLDQSCIPMTKRCDGVDHCPQGEDEWDCIKQEGDMLLLRHRRLLLPVCAESWTDEMGNYTCEVLLGEGHFLSSSEVLYNGLTFAKLQENGDTPSLLGNMVMAFDCLDNKAIQIQCKARGCGKRMLKEKTLRHIANGEDAAHGNWPWHAALYMGSMYFCGGTLINEQFVITAAHCVEKYKGDFFTKMTVKLGANNRKKNEVTQRVISVQAISSHSMHVWFERNDIALLQLANPVNFTDFIQPVCLPDENEPLPLHSECWTIGWGKTKWDADYAEVLQQLKMTLWDTQKCNSSIAWNGEVYDTFLCAGYYSGVRSICKGDSGGPLLCLDRQQVWRLVGINSYVANFCNMTERPNIFTNVSHFLPWIEVNTECKFRCDNGKCLYSSDSICDRIDDCGDNSDEIRVCNFTASCNFDDKFLCGYNWTGWGHGFDNKQAIMIELDGQFHTQSYAPQFDSTRGSLPGYFFYGKLKNFKEALLWSPKFKISGTTCVRFSYYQRGEIREGLDVYIREFYQNGSYATHQTWRSPVYITGIDEWQTGYFELLSSYFNNMASIDFQLLFKTNELLKVAVDDVRTIPGRCRDVLCDSQREFRCVTDDGRDKCIPLESRCNLVIDCKNEEDERSCTTATNSFICTCENGNICGLRQNFGDGSDWWLTNGTFVKDESLQRTFEDHTLKTELGRMFYLNAYNLQSDSAIYMSQFFYLKNVQYCLSFYYIRKADVNFTVHVQSDNYYIERHSLLPTFYGWTLFQVNLPRVETVNITYDIRGLNVSFYSYVVIDDIQVKPGNCPYYDCPAGYTKCDTIDRCFPGRSRCDRNVDCQDESDEANCECNANEFGCRNGRCIPENKMCDRTIQCLDGSDEQSCESYTSVTCDFQHPYLCGYEFESVSKYSWRRGSGRTPTPVTGPQSDHTLGNDRGYYVYAEANEGAKNDSATVRSPQFSTGYGNSIEFWYHMFSSSPFDTKPGVLFFILENANTGAQSVKWASDNTDLVDAWRRLCFDLPTGETLMALFTAIRNETTVYGVDFAVDDVKFNSYRCADAPRFASSKTTTTTSPTTTTTDSSSTQAKYYCSNGIGIDPSYRCDGEPDCSDGSDERDCPP